MCVGYSRAQLKTLSSLLKSPRIFKLDSDFQHSFYSLTFLRTSDINNYYSDKRREEVHVIRLNQVVAYINGGARLIRNWHI